MSDIMKMVKSFGECGLLMKTIRGTVKRAAK